MNPLRAALLSLLSLLGPLSAQAASEPACAIRNVRIDPLPAGQFQTYAGQTATLEIRLSSARSERETDNFAEPPLRLRHRESGGSCDIYGGIWPRNGIYLDQSERTLITVEYSGSGESLNFYDTANCKRLKQLDVSGKTWSFSAKSIVLTPKDGKVKPRSLRVDHHCKPY